MLVLKEQGSQVTCSELKVRCGVSKLNCHRASRDSLQYRKTLGLHGEAQGEQKARIMGNQNG